MTKQQLVQQTADLNYMIVDSINKVFLVDFQAGTAVRQNVTTVLVKRRHVGYIYSRSVYGWLEENGYKVTEFRDIEGKEPEFDSEIFRFKFEKIVPSGKKLRCRMCNVEEIDLENKKAQVKHFNSHWFNFQAPYGVEMAKFYEEV